MRQHKWVQSPLLGSFVLHALPVLMWLTLPSLRPVEVTFNPVEVDIVTEEAQPAPAIESEAAPAVMEEKIVQPIQKPANLPLSAIQKPANALPIIQPKTVAQTVAKPADTRKKPVMVVKQPEIGQQSGGEKLQEWESTDGALPIMLTYEQKIQQQVEGHKRYAALLRERMVHGMVSLHFQIDRSGKLLGATVENSSGNEDLDGLALKILHQSAPFIPPPNDYAANSNQLDFLIPLTF